MKYIYLWGGLGNQMFIYALYIKLKKTNINLKIDTSFFKKKNTPELTLNNSFNLYLQDDIHDLSTFDYYSSKLTSMIISSSHRFFLNEKEFEVDNRVFDYQYHILQGYFQTDNYWKDIKKEIIDTYQFKDVDSTDFLELEKIILNNNTVSVHIRMGDYTKEPYKSLYSNICTKEYYTKAIDYMKNHVSNVQFIVFSNDMNWVKSNLFNNDISVIFVSDYIKDNYPDWWDMKLMSECKHNIIAHSSFSWWGSYLNKYKDKIVIAPKKWINTKDAKDICPKEWVRIDG